jgi:hydrogenase maturation protein HypF
MFSEAQSQIEPIQRERVTVEGAVQGVGFRPFVYRLAHDLGLVGFVRNTPAGVTIEVEGSDTSRAAFKKALHGCTLPQVQIVRVVGAPVPLLGEAAFTIRASQGGTETTALILPDLDVCDDCLAEMRNPQDRRYRYPFINCTNCGPRFSIITALPYDRPNTTMAGFKMCSACRSEYAAPANRRYHAQPIACPDCGPQLVLLNNKGERAASGDKALQTAVRAMRNGKILALKGLGGFQLMCDARNQAAVSQLRRCKYRPHKPFALMYPRLQDVYDDCKVTPKEAELLSCAAAPIVLLRKQACCSVVPEVAPANAYLGVMLPGTPVHHLLLTEFGAPLVATSGNRANEPICIDETQAVDALGAIADVFLVHNRPISGRCDDSVVRVVKNQVSIMRRARGFAPLPVTLKHKVDAPVLAVGGHLKNTVALAVGQQVFLSPHIGDLDTLGARDAHHEAVQLLCGLYQVEPDQVVTDMHPDYYTTQLAEQRTDRTFTVQHHYAHALACMADNGITAPCLAVVWDGTGYGTDHTVWGGEFLTIKPGGYHRALHFMRFPLPGGDAAVKDPKRTALGMLYVLDGEAAFKGDINRFGKHSQLMQAALTQNINCPMTSSAGRIFDAVAVLTGVCMENGFEGQAAMALEYVADPSVAQQYDFVISDAQIDWRPLLRGVLHDVDRGLATGTIAAKFHRTLVAMIVAAAQVSGETTVLLSGGCFQNALLLEWSIDALQNAGFNVYWHHQVPPNDGGLALGQILALVARGQVNGE